MRSKPSFQSDASQSQNASNDSPGCLNCLGMLLVVIASYFIFVAIDRVLSGRGNNLDHLICYAVLIGFVILIIAAKNQTDRDKTKLKQARRQWERASKSAEVAILDRRHYAGGSWEDEYDIPHYSRPSYSLTLEMTADQKKLSPNVQTVTVMVDENIYTNLIDKNVVRVYYHPDSPMTFLLDEELD